MVPEALKNRTQWLVWRFESKEGQKKPAKMPYYASGRRRTGKQGDEADRQALTTFDFAMQTKSLGTTDAGEKFDGIGFAFLPGDGLIGIDLDRVIDEATGEISERAGAMIKACSSFAEYSPSRQGVHIYVLGETQSFKDNGIGVEVFCGRQFFTVTGEHYPETPATVNAIDEKTLKRLRATVDQAKDSRGSGTKKKDRQTPQGKSDFAIANDVAIRNLDLWVPALFPSAQRSSLGWRITSKDLGRSLQEDLSITSQGIVDFGVSDMGDAREGRRTPIDLVMEWGKGSSPAEALNWLSDRLGTPKAKKKRGGPSAPPPDDASGGPEDPGKKLPTIRWVDGKLPAIVTEAEDALLEAGERLFQRDRMLVRVIRRSSHSVRSYRKPPGTLSIMMVDAPYLVEAFTRVARWERFDSRLNDWKRINAPDRVAVSYLSRAGHWRLPELASAISAPTLRPDGTVLQKPGYDKAMRCWYEPCGIEFPEIPETPTREQAQEALELLTKALSTFPFDDRASSVDAEPAPGVNFSVALALTLCGLVRRSLPAAPLGAISAPVMASGKTLLADFISIVATGAAAPAMSFAATDEEAQKSALAVLVEGDAVVLIDNIERPLQGEWLCSILTSETFSQRVLGRSEMARVPTTTLILATGNHLVIAGDLRTRALLCRIDPKVERPEERKFDHDLREWAMSHRPQLVAAGLTVMRAFIALGQQGKDHVPPWGRFERWSEMVRAPLVWLGCQDPCASIKALEDEDPDRSEHLRLMHEWREAFGDKPTSAREAVQQAANDTIVASKASALQEIFREIATDRGGTISSRRLGKWLQRYAGRRAKGRQFIKEGEQNHVALWKVEVFDKG